VGGVEQAASASFTLAADAPVQQYLRIPLQVPAGGTTPDGSYTYTPNDCSVGDLDGDGEYEIIVKWDPTNSKDNSQSGYTGNVYLDAYKLTGTQLWRIDLGKNIRAGAHYTQFFVYDFDGDGKAELVCKTAPGTKDGTGTFIAQPGKFTGTPPAVLDHNADYRNTAGYILTGPEFFTVFNGLTGAEMATTNYVVPRSNDPTSPDVTPWGDNYGNRVDRFLGCVAYLDGQRPSFVLGRGYYTRAVLAAWDWRDGKLTQRWLFDSGHTGTVNPLANWRGQGAHSLTVGDVDGDGRDEITYGACAIDDDGTGLYSTLLGHGDALHMSDMDPTRPGQEVWMVHEDPGSYGPNGLEFRDAKTGALIFGLSGAGADVGRGCAGDIDPRYLGYEMWGARGNLSTVNGTSISTNKPPMNFMVWWDGDLLREILDNTTISKWDWNTNTAVSMLSPSGIASNNSTKATPNLSADIMGDWREEVIWRESTNDALRIYTTTIPTATRLPTLMHDRQYRLAIAWQNVAYNQPPHPSFYLGVGMTTPALPDIVTSLASLTPLAPAVSSINRYDPTINATGATSVTFRVTFTQPVTGVDATDFVVTPTGSVTGTVSTVTQLTGFSYNVTVGSITSTGTLRLDLKASGTGITGPGAVPITGGFTTGQLYNRATLAWTNQASGGLWSDPANWDGGVIANDVGAVPIFGNFELLANNTVVLDTPRTISGLTFGDTNPATAASWLIDNGGNDANVLTLDTTSGVPTNTVNTLGTGAVATIAVPLAGNDGFAKSGPGTLILTKPATLTGAFNVNAGTLRFVAGSSITASTVNIAAGNGLLDISGGAFTATGNTTVNGSGGSLILNSGTATLAAVATNNSAGGLIRVNGGTFTATSINIPRSSDATPSFASGFVVTGGDATVNGTVGIGTNNSWGSMSVEGGATTVTGAITVGNLSGNSTRGGQLRVAGGTLNATNTVDGIILVRANANTATAAFSGGTSNVEKFKFGFNNTVTAGSATLTVNGGSLYLGSGGFVRNGIGTFVSTITLQSGLLGASANWSTDMPITLPTGGNITLKTANAANDPFAITLTGALSGAGGLTKTGAGTLTLAGTNTYTGTTRINAGTLRVDGSLTTSAILINDTGTLTGTGAINVPVTLNGGGALLLGGSAPNVFLGVNNLTWAGGGSLFIDVGANGANDRLVLAGALTKGGLGNYAFVLNAGAGFAAGNTYTLATFASTDFNAADFSALGLPAGFAGKFSLNGTGLQVTIVGTPFITSAANAAGTFGSAFNYATTAGNVPDSFSASGLPAGLSINALTGLISGTPTESGTFNVILGATNIAGTGNAPLTLSIAKAVSPVTLGSLKPFYDGTPRLATAITAPTGLNVTFTYNGEATAPTLPGTYAVAATINDANHQGTITGTLVVNITALVRHAPAMIGSIDGSVQVLSPENFALSGQSFISGDLLVPGTAAVQLNGHPTLGGIIDSSGSAGSTNYTVTLNDNAIIRTIVRRVDPLALSVVPAPGAPTGTRIVSLSTATQSPGDFATLRNLTLSGTAGMITVPPGTYGSFTANGNSGFVLGVAGATEPALYNLQSLSLNVLPGSAKIQIVGPVIITLNNSTLLNGLTGSPANPRWLILRIANGGLTLSGNAAFYGDVVAPNGSVIINGTATLTGTVTADRLTLNGTSLLVQPAP
jgi:autotransporter-associated beta strand protein